MAAPVFISYSHHDQAYVAQLTQHLRNYGLQPWTDEGIEHGDQWAHTIEEQIRNCGAFIPVMSINARKADWVRREILFAQGLKKPILPLLLSGTRFIELIDLHDEDVTGGNMPRQPFIDRLRNIVFTPDPDPAELARRHDLARSLTSSGEHREAVAVLRELVAARTRVLGADHPDTLRSRDSLAFNLSISSEAAEAVAVLRELVAARTRVLGADHPDTLQNRHVLAFNLARIGEHREAVAVLREAVAARTRVLGADHPDTLRSRDSLALNLSIIGEHREAVAVLREAVAARTRVLGADHPDTLQSRSSLASDLARIGERREAVAVLREVVAARTRVLGADHPDTRASRSHLRRYEPGT